MYVNLSQSPWQPDEADIIICPTVEVRRKGTEEWGLWQCSLLHSHRPGFGGQGGNLLEVDGLQIVTIEVAKNKEVVQSQRLQFAHM